MLTSSSVSSLNTLSPSCYRTSAGINVTLTGVNLGRNDDITHVFFNGTLAAPVYDENNTLIAPIYSQSSSRVIVALPASSAVGDTVVMISSTFMGNTTSSSSSMFLYSTGTGGVITGAVPSTGPNAGGNVVTINGEFIGSGTDITSVTICGVSTSLVSQNRNRVVVITGGPKTGVCTVVVSSTCVGTSLGFYMYRYNQRTLLAVVMHYCLVLLFLS